MKTLLSSLLVILFNLPAQAMPPKDFFCSTLKNYAAGHLDSTYVLQDCVDKTPISGTLILPKGVFLISNELMIDRSMTITTDGLTPDSPACGTSKNHDCAEIKASPSIYVSTGFVKVRANFVTLDHLVFNGNKQERYKSLAASECQHDVNIYGQNPSFIGDSITIRKSVFKNALCGTGLYLISGSNFLVSETTVIDNGIHSENGLWSDGLTALEIKNSIILNNNFIDNTDVDLIFGACPDCKIQGNSISHKDDFDTSSFAAIIIHAWPNGGTSGNYIGADISNNKINCTINRRCGFGLYIGSSAWYNSYPFGGTVHDNSIFGAQQGFAVDKAKDFSIYNNDVRESYGWFKTSCGRRHLSSYIITPGTNVDRSKDKVPNCYYVESKLDGCIANWWKSQY